MHTKNKETKTQSVGFWVHKLDCSIKKNLDLRRVLAGGGDDQGRYRDWFIRYLYEHTGTNVFQKDLEKYFSIGRSTVTGILQNMEKEGYITRETVENDARLKKVVLTQKGMAYQASVNAKLDRFNVEVIEGIDSAELEQFFDTLKKILDNSEKLRKNTPAEQ